ncbi:MAG: hypothetical protein ACRDPY_41275 [Streptosporangiaceae bacterium]
MKFRVLYSTAYSGVDPDAMVAVARHAEDRGFESFYLPEHIVLYPGASVGTVTFPPGLTIADPLECLSFVAAATDLSTPAGDRSTCPPTTSRRTPRALLTTGGHRVIRLVRRAPRDPGSAAGSRRIRILSC